MYSIFKSFLDMLHPKEDQRLFSEQSVSTNNENMSLEGSNPTQTNEDLEFLNSSTNALSKSPVRKRATHQSPTKGINMSNNNNNNNKSVDQENESPTPQWNWKINSQNNDAEDTESQPLQLNRKNKLQNSDSKELPATQEDKSADESKSRNQSNNNSQNIDMTLELARERLQSDVKEDSQENMELRRQRLELLKQMEDEEDMEKDNNLQNEHYDDATIDPNATIDVHAESLKRKQLENTTNEEKSNDTTTTKKTKLMIDLLEDKPDNLIEEDINATLPFQLGTSPQKEASNKKVEKEENDENTQPMDEEVSLKRKKKTNNELQNSTELPKEPNPLNYEKNANNLNQQQDKSTENSQNTQPMEIDESLGRVNKSKSQKKKKEDDGSDTEPLADEGVPAKKKSADKIGGNSSLEAILGPCSVREVKQDNLKRSDFVDWETEKAHFERQEQDNKVAEKIQSESNSNNNIMTEQERLDFELAQKLQNELDQAPPKKEEPKPKEVEQEGGEVCLSENEKKMFEYFKKKKEQEEIDRRMAEELAKQLEEEDKKIQQKNNTNNNANNQHTESPKKDLPAKMDNTNNANNNARKDNNENNSNNANKHILEIEYPNYWEKQASDQQLFTLDKNSNEFKSIANRFFATANGDGLDEEMASSNYYITKIQRNQNRRLWMWYLLRKKEVQETSKYPNEKFLFHGSAEENYEAILKEGLDLRLANAEGSIGAGIYFAPHSATSVGYLSGSDWNRMLLCRVTLGIVGDGEYGLKRPPAGYDSVGAEEEMFVIFDSHQAYPEYIISFSTKNGYADDYY